MQKKHLVIFPESVGRVNESMGSVEGSSNAGNLAVVPKAELLCLRHSFCFVDIDINVNVINKRFGICIGEQDDRDLIDR